MATEKKVCCLGEGRAGHSSLKAAKRQGKAVTSNEAQVLPEVNGRAGVCDQGNQYESLREVFQVK